MKSILSVLVLVTAASTCSADNSCRSMKADTIDKYDNKVLRRVSCYCNCSEQGIMEDRGECSKCHHFHAEPSPIIVSTPTERAKVAQKVRATDVQSSEAATSAEYDVQVICSAVKKTHWKRSSEAAKEALFRPLTLTTNRAE